MFGTHDLALFVATALVLNATPGVDMLFTLRARCSTDGEPASPRRSESPAGCVVHTVAAAAWTGGVAGTSALAFTAIKWLGAAYLFWLAWGHATRRRLPGR